MEPCTPRCAICDITLLDGAQDPPFLKMIMKTIDNVRERGWQIMCIGGNETQAEFSYTIGLWHSFKHPEMLISGLPAKLAASMLNDLGERVRGGHIFVEGDVIKDIASVPIVLRSIHESWLSDAAAFAARVYGTELPDILNLVFPDEQGRFPWDEGYTLSAGLQPARWEPMPA